MKTAQQIFNIVVAHFLFQRVPALAEPECYGWTPTCQYRIKASELNKTLKPLLPSNFTEDSVLKCAAGAVIPDEQYKSEYENQSISALCEDGRVNIADSPHSRQLLQALQSLHDQQRDSLINANTSIRLKDIAREYKLDASVVVW